MKKILLPFLSFFIASLCQAIPASISEFIKTDQFGYTTTAQKIAVVSDPQVGYNAALSFSPGTTYEVRNWITDALVFSGPLTAWNSGTVQAQSGDKVFW